MIAVIAVIAVTAGSRAPPTIQAAPLKGRDMCFSATASFTAGAALVATGGLTLRKSQGRTELPLAIVPLLFGLQQITEGILWLSLRRDWPLLQVWTTNVYSMFSHVLWPILVPFAIALVETKRRRRAALGVFQTLGLAVGLYLLYFLVQSTTIAHIHYRSIVYDSPHFYLGAVLVLYLLATCVSGLLSSHRCINAFGVLAFILAVAAYQVSARTFVSVWCFFAAILSLTIYLHFSRPMQACRPALTRSGASVSR